MATIKTIQGVSGNHSGLSNMEFDRIKNKTKVGFNNEFTGAPEGFSFFSEYDPSTRFTYYIYYNENGELDSEKTEESMEKAFEQAYNYHITFEQPLPVYEAKIEFYGSYNNGTLGDEKTVVLETQSSGEQYIDEIGKPWPTFTDATAINKRAYNEAGYVKIDWGTSAMKVPYLLTELLNKINAVFDFNLPLERGVYWFDKISGEWKPIEELK